MKCNLPSFELLTIYLFPFLLLFLPVLCPGQVVSTLPIKELDGPNGFAIDSRGDLYVANEPGKKVIKITGDSISRTILNCDSPDGLDFDNEDNLFVSNFYSGIILRKHENSIDTFASGLDHPADIKWDGEEYLYVSEYDKGDIKKINREGKITTVASGFKHPFGLIFDNSGNLYIANNSTGIINKADKKGQVSFFAHIPGVISYLSYSKQSGKLYVPCFSCNTIYVVNNRGKAAPYTGMQIAGDKDGTLKEAQFREPNSIIISNDGDIYISEFSVNRIRKIAKAEK
jgi:sugar lactone lactonase YvrE